METLHMGNILASYEIRYAFNYHQQKIQRCRDESARFAISFHQEQIQRYEDGNNIHISAEINNFKRGSAALTVYPKMSYFLA